jgi:hypothetical protein
MQVEPTLADALRSSQRPTKAAHDLRQIARELETVIEPLHQQLNGTLAAWFVAEVPNTEIANALLERARDVSEVLSAYVEPLSAPPG